MARRTSAKTTRRAGPAALRLPEPGDKPRPFRIRHSAGPPFDWEIHLDGGEGGDVILRLPRGLPWAEDEAREARIPPEEGALDAPTWDEGRYRVLDAGADKKDKDVTIDLAGARLRGRYAIRSRGSRLSLARLDPPTVRPFPDRVQPMLAHTASYPARPEEYAFEMKWDGIRALAHLRDGKLTIRTRNLHNVTDRYPELAPLSEALAGHDAVLDGEIVALDEEGRPSFQRLQDRMGVTQRGVAKERSEDVPVLYAIFDILHLDGHDTTRLPYEERRRLLGTLELRGPAWLVPPHEIGDGHGLLAMPGWEGVVAKRLGSVYEPGARSRAWLKIKSQRRQELVIGGWTAGKGSRGGQIGAILVGYYEGDRFVYAGSVGTGFTQRMLADLKKLLAPDERATSPFDTPVDKKEATFVEPRHVAEFEFTEWTSDGRLRHPSYKGLREDKDPREVVREET